MIKKYNEILNKRILGGKIIGIIKSEVMNSGLKRGIRSKVW